MSPLPRPTYNLIALPCLPLSFLPSMAMQSQWRGRQGQSSERKANGVVGEREGSEVLGKAGHRKVSVVMGRAGRKRRS